MAYLSSFRGYAGEATMSYVRLDVWLTLIPVYIVWFIVGYLVVKLPSDGIWQLTGSVFTGFVGSFLVGRFAIPATHGDVHHGLFTDQIELSENIAYAVRHMVVVFVYELPIIGLLYLADLSIPFGALLSPSVLITAGVQALIGFAIGLIAVTIPVVGYIVCLTTDSIIEALAPERWSWVIIERMGDLLLFVAASIGGSVLFLLLYAIPIFAVLAAIASMSFELGLAVGMLSAVIPFAGAPILLGRMCGAFVHGRDMLQNEIPSGFVSPTSPLGALSKPSTVAPVAKAPASPVPSAAPAASFAAYTADPSNELLSWLRDLLPRFSDVQVAYVVMKVVSASAPVPVLALGLLSDTKLGDRQRLTKEITAAVASSTVPDKPTIVIVMTDVTQPMIEEAGLRVYQKR